MVDAEDVHALRRIGARRAALVMPDLRPVAELVVAYVEAVGSAVTYGRALEVDDNAAVGCILVAGARRRPLARPGRCDALVADHYGKPAGSGGRRDEAASLIARWLSDLA